MGQRQSAENIGSKPPIVRSNKQSFDVSIPSRHPTIGLSSFENLIPPLFVKICHHLSSNELMSVPRISKHIKNRFDPITCCRGYLNVDLAIGSNQNRELLMLRSATRLSLHHRACIATQQAIDNTIHALTSGSLESLHLVEQNFIINQSVLLPLLQHCASPTNRLRELHIQFESNAPLSSNQHNSFMQSWNGLKQCEHLTYLCFESHRFVPFQSWRALYEALPNSLKEFHLKVGIPSEDPLAVWQTMLQSNEFLPFLRKFYIIEDISYDRDIAVIIQSTIMSQTNTIRPISYWLVGASVDEIRTFPLHQLHFGSLSEAAEKMLLECASNVWPDLESLKILVQPGSNDFAALNNLLSLRHITELDIGIREDAESCFASEQMTFGHLPTLRFLRITIGNYQSERVGDLFLADSLPNLEVLHLRCYHMSLQRLENVIKAASHCRQVALGDDGKLSPSLMLAMTLHYCRSVVLVDFTTDWVRREEHVEDVIRAFKLYPVDAHHMQNLVRISMPVDRFCDSALHLLNHQLSTAPLLQAFHANAGDSLLRMYILISLPFVRNMPLDRHNGLLLIPQKQRNKLMNKFVEKLVVPSISELEIRHRDSLFCQSEDFEQIMITDKTDKTHTIVPMFRQEADRTGLTGRQHFASHVRKILSKRQQARLSAWDAADYSICTSRNSSEVRKLSRPAKGVTIVFRRTKSPDTCHPLSTGLTFCAIP